MSSRMDEVWRLLGELEKSADAQVAERQVAKQAESTLNIHDGMNKQQSTKKERRYYRASNNLARLRADGTWLVDRQVYYKKAGWFTPETKVILYYLFLYEEDGIFYDFFGGTAIGRREIINGEEWLVHDGHSLAHFGWYKSYLPDIEEYPASKFADDVKQYMPYREKIAQYIKDMLSGMEEDRRREIAMKEAKKREQEQADAEKRSWLDDVISAQKR